MEGWQIATMATIFVFLITYVVTAIVSFNCMTRKDWNCSRNAGAVAIVFGCLISCACAVLAWSQRSRD